MPRHLDEGFGRSVIFQMPVSTPPEEDLVALSWTCCREEDFGRYGTSPMWCHCGRHLLDPLLGSCWCQYMYECAGVGSQFGSKSELFCCCRWRVAILVVGGRLTCIWRYDTSPVYDGLLPSLPLARGLVAAMVRALLCSL